MNWTDTPQFNSVARLSSVSAELRSSIRNGSTARAEHVRYFDTLPVVKEIEVGGFSSRVSEAPQKLRVVAWNVERLRHMDAIVNTMRDLNADVMMLSEIDRGMARTGNSDRIVELADRLHLSYSYAVEFIELDLGDPDEKRDHAGEDNLDGYHGASNLTALPAERHFLIRLDRRGDWFDGSREQPRVGGRIGLGCVVAMVGGPVVMVNVHMESHGDPEERAGDMRQLLSAIDQVEPGAAVLVGGDFNTSTASYDQRSSNWAAWDAEIRANPDRLLEPQSYEPMFEVARSFGYDFDACNVARAPTTRHPEGSSRSPAKIDWFFTRGLKASSPQIIPAVQEDGTPSSDHEAIAVTVEIA